MSSLALTAADFLNIDKVNNLKEAMSNPIIHKKYYNENEAKKSPLPVSIHETTEGYENYQEYYGSPIPVSVDFNKPKTQQTNWNQPPVQEYGFRYNQNQMSNSNDNIDNTLMMKKLNYIIKLLEDETDNKNDSSMENIIMFCLIGIFTIFVIDSFVRIGKYTR
jgi:hypothetical protein